MGLNMHPNAQKFVDENKNNTFTYPHIPEDIANWWEQTEWAYTKSLAPWLELLIDAPYAEMLEEAKNLRELFVEHRGDENSHQGWHSLCVHGISATHTGSAESYGMTWDTAPYTWTEIQDRCPVTVNYFKNTFPYTKYHRLRYMLLEPGGYITPHQDNQRRHLHAAVNISLNHPENCNMVTTDGCLPFKNTGSVFLFDNGITHAVYNDSDIPRYHIIVHGEPKNPDWNRLVLDSYKKAQNG
jgi:hypothetical protein